MNVLERLKVCSTCKNREFDPNCGVVCSLTKKKPMFDESCANYTAVDHSEAKQVANAVMNSSAAEFEATVLPRLKTDDSISGWLAFFLYVVVGAGGILGATITTSLFGKTSIFTMFLPEGEWLTLMLILPIIYSLIPLALSIATIVAFNKKESNAVSLASTYLATSAIYGVVLLILSAIIEAKESSIPSIAVAELIWCGLWLLYLTTSHKIAVIIPRAKRTWKSFEKCLLLAAIALAACFIVSCIYVDKSMNDRSKGINHPTQNIEYQGW